MDRKRVGIYAIAAAGLAAAGQGFLAFGPVAFGEWLGSGKSAEQRRLSESQAVLINRNSDVIQGLNETLRRIAVEADSSPDGPAGREVSDTAQPAPDLHTSAPPAADPVTRGSDRQAGASPDEGAAHAPNAGSREQAALPELTPVVLPRGELPERPPAGDRPSERDGKTPDEPAHDAEEPVARAFGVFENEDFELCGYTGFTARILDSGAAGIVLRSQDGGIPGRSFRGYEKRLALKTPINLWPGCTVAVASTDQAGVRRLVFSVISGGKQ